MLVAVQNPQISLIGTHMNDPPVDPSVTLDISICFLLMLLRLNLRKELDQNRRMSPLIFGVPQLWGRFIWLILGFGYISTKTPFRWEQLNHIKMNLPNNTQHLRWVPCDSSTAAVTLKASDWFGID